MKSFLEKAKNFFWGKGKKERFLFLDFSPKGVFVKVFCYCQKSGLVKYKYEKLFLNLSEKSFFNDRMFRFFINTVFLPFYFKIIVNVDGKLAFSRYTKIDWQRKDPKIKITQDEIQLFFSGSIWKVVDDNKKEAIKRIGLEDTDVVISDHKILDVYVDGKRLTNFDDIFENTGKKITVGVYQNFISRPFFEKFLKNLPNRAGDISFFENGVSLALLLYLKEASKTKKETEKKFLVASIKKELTKVFVFNGKSCFYFDSFSWGYKDLILLLEKDYGICPEIFFDFIRSLVEEKMSPSARFKINALIRNELSHLYNGIVSAQRENGVENAFIDGGDLSFLLAFEQKYSKMLMSQKNFIFDKIIDFGFDQFNFSHQAEICFLFKKEERNVLDKVSIQLIRWLLPHNY